jgi:hypothetical protein
MASCQMSGVGVRRWYTPARGASARRALALRPGALAGTDRRELRRLRPRRRGHEALRRGGGPGRRAPLRRPRGDGRDGSHDLQRADPRRRAADAARVGQRGVADLDGDRRARGGRAALDRGPAAHQQRLPDDGRGRRRRPAARGAAAAGRGRGRAAARARRPDPPPQPPRRARGDRRRLVRAAGRRPPGGRPSPALDPRTSRSRAGGGPCSPRAGGPSHASAGPCRRRRRPSSCRAAARRSSSTRGPGSCRS